MKVTVGKKDNRYTSLKDMPPGYGRIQHSWNDAGSPDTIYAGRVIFKRLSDGKMLWDDNKEMVIPDEVREAEIEMLNEGDWIKKVLESQDAPMK
jgi:hypothetical protein